VSGSPVDGDSDDRMVGRPGQSGFDEERDVDLGSWRRAVGALWWLPVGGIVVGAVAGVLYSFRGLSSYKAEALISLGQVTSPAGAAVSNFAVNPLAVAQIVDSSAAQAEAGAEAGVPASALRGRVSVAQVGTASASSGRSAPLVSLTVTGRRPGSVAAAATALARIAVRRTTQPYLEAKITTLKATLDNVDRQLATTSISLRTLERSLHAHQHLSPLQRLVVVSEADDVGAREGNLVAQQGTLAMQLAFANKVESARVIEAAAAVKSTAQSRTTSLLVGALIGLIVGAFAAVVRGTEGRVTPSTA